MAVRRTAGFADADPLLMENLDDLENAPRYAAWLLVRWRRIDVLAALRARVHS